MSLSFRLQLPADAAFRPLAADAAARLAEIAGGSAAEAATFSASVSEALDALGTASDPVDLAFRAESADLEVVIECRGQSHVRRGVVSDPKG